MGERARDFLVKRAPFYLAGVALIIVFVVPPILEKDLEDVIPMMQDERDQEILEYVLGYTGPNETGIDVAGAISAKIESEYPDGNAYDHRSTTVQVAVMPTSVDTYRVTLDFESQGERLYFDWDIDTAAGQVRGNNDITKDVIDVVDFYD